MIAVDTNILVHAHRKDASLHTRAYMIIQQLAEDFARYLYLPRLRDSGVLTDAIRSGLGLLTWEQDSFAYAESYDETTSRYRGLQMGKQVWVTDDSPTGLLVKPETAKSQLVVESPAAGSGIPQSPGGPSGVRPAPAPGGGGAPTQAQVPVSKRFHGSATLDPTRVGRDAGRIADEVVAHLSGILGAKVRVTLEIEAEIPSGVPDSVVRTVTENCRTLKFSSQGFEKE